MTTTQENAELEEHNQLVRDGLRFEQRVELNKLEAEL